MNIQKTALSDEATLFAPAGELDAYTGPQLREELAEAVADGARWLVLDMSRVEYIDSVGLGIIVGAAKRTVEQGGNLAVVAARPNVLRVFEISGTRELLNVVETLDEARERLSWPVGGCGCDDAPAPADHGVKGGEQ
ncbi:STAS domain-containing protein [bacterium]|nr:STAS domain-containing protein [bacterium]